jgi:ElaB/YqjD/DUF883 family membrane-anchored ribosome-binding protein
MSKKYDKEWAKYFMKDMAGHAKDKIRDVHDKAMGLLNKTHDKAEDMGQKGAKKIREHPLNPFEKARKGLGGKR